MAEDVRETKRRWRRRLVIGFVALVGAYVLAEFVITMWLTYSPQARRIRSAVGSEVIWTDAGGKEHRGILESAGLAGDDGFFRLKIVVVGTQKEPDGSIWSFRAGVNLNPWELGCVNTSPPPRAAAGPEKGAGQ